MAYFYSNRREDTGLGWNTQLRTNAVTRAATSEGHEVITRAAFLGGAIPLAVGGAPVVHTLSRTDQDDIMLGNRSVDLGTHDADESGAGLRSILVEAEQKRHALRLNLGQSQAAALADIRAEFLRQHASTLAETDPRRRMRRIGVTLHLIQDSFSPAHMDRNFASGNCIRYTRNFGRGSAPLEHGKPDSRDSVTAPLFESAAAAANRTAGVREATRASVRYLQIVLKALRGGAAATEAAAEVPVFMTQVFRAC